MTVSATDTRFTYAGDGVAIVFSYPRQFQASTDLRVYLVNTSSGVAALQVLATDYAVTGAGDVNGGSVTMNVAPAAGYTLVIYRDTDPTQGLDLDNVTSFPMASVEAALDRAMLTIGEIGTKLSRAILAPLTRLGSFDYTLPAPSPLKMLGVNSAATGFELRDPPVWLAGAADPTGADGAVGDFWLNTTSGAVFKKTGASSWTLQANIRGPSGTNGTNGTNGTDGARWYSASGAPAGGTGVVGDWAVDTVTGDVYEKTGVATWTLQLTLSGGGGGSGDVVGPAGATDGRIAVFDGATGKLIKDSGYTAASFAAAAHTHTSGSITDFAEAVDDRVNALFVAGTNITFSYNDAAGTFTVNASGGGQYVAQITETASTTPATFAAVALIPEDATIPQNTEGVQLMTHTHTPLKAGNKLLVECDLSLANDGYYGALLALFRDSVADALMTGATMMGGAVGDGGRGHISFIYTAPDTTPVTFKVRAAPTWTASTIYFNRPVAGAYYGGVERSAIRVTEYDPSASFTGTDKMPTGTYGDIYVPTAGTMRVQLVDAAPATPPADTVRLFRQKVGGRNMLAVRGPSGLDAVMQPHMARNKVAWWNPAGNTVTAPPVVGFNTPTTIGTATIRSVATTNMATRAKRMGYVSAATAGSLSGHQNVSATSQFTVGNGSGLGGWHSVTRFCVSDAAAVAGARMFVGVRNAVAAPTNVEPDTLTQCVGVAAISSSNNLHIVYGGTAAQTKIDLGANFPANSLSADLYELSLFSSPYSGDVYWQVTRLNTGDTASGQIVNSGAVVLPTASLLLGVVAWRCNNATALAVGLDLAMHYVETDN